MSNLDHLLDDALLGFDDDDEVSRHSPVGRQAPVNSSVQAAATSTAPAASSSSLPPQQCSSSQAGASQASSSAVPAGSSQGLKSSLQFDPLKRKKKTSSKPAAGAAGIGTGPSSSSSAARPALTPQVQQLQEDLAKLVNEWSQAMHPEAETDAAAAAAAVAGQQRSTSSVLQALAEQTQRTVQEQARMRPPPAGAAAAAAAAGGGGGEQMTAIVDVVMQHLLSKDVLYQPMKEIMEQYPPWLDKQTAAGSSSTLSSEDLERYKAQYDCIRQLVAAYETEPDNTTKIMGLLQDMQACGEPPADIVEQMSSAISADLPSDAAAAAGGGLLGPESLGLDDVDLEQLPPELKNCPVQ